MIVNEEDYDTYLEHFGVKGMHWGQRKADGSGGHETAKKVAKGVAAGAVIVGGAAASVYVLKKHGAKKAIEVGMKSYAKAKTIKGVTDKIKSDYGYQKPNPTTAKGAQATAKLAEQDAWKKNVNDVLGDMRQANKEQDAWMRKQGLGAAINND